MIQRIDDLEDRVFSFYGESQDAGFVRDRCLADPVVSSALDADDLFDRIDEHREASAGVFVDALRLESSVVGRSLMLFFWTYHAQSRKLDPSDLAYVRNEATTLLTRVDLLYLEFLRITGLASGGIEPCERVLSELREIPSVKSDLVATFARCWLGVAEMQHRNEDSALVHFEKARDLCERRRFLSLLMAQWRIGTLRWQLGETEKALEIHRDRSARQLAKRFGKWGWLLQSYSSAAKCALDANRLEAVREEIDAAERLIEQADIVLNPFAVGNFRHFRGQYHWRLGEHEEAKRWVREALRIYKEAGEVRDGIRGALEANVTLAEFALESGEYDVLGAHLSGLIQAAERAEYRDLQGRLVAIQRRLVALGAAAED